MTRGYRKSDFTLLKNIGIYATEAASACKQYAFNVLGYPKILSYTTLKNIPSQKVAEKIGMETYKFFENGEQHIVQVTYDNKIG